MQSVKSDAVAWQSSIAPPQEAGSNTKYSVFTYKLGYNYFVRGKIALAPFHQAKVNGFVSVVFKCKNTTEFGTSFLIKPALLH